MKSVKLLLSVLLIFLISVLFGACNADYDFTPRPTVPIENPKLALKEFVECIKERDFEGCERYVSNYADLGFELENASDSDAVTEFFYECLIDSYKVEFLDNDNMVSITDSISETDFSVVGSSATVTFRFTTFDMAALSDRMAILVSEIGHDHMFHGTVYDSSEKVDELVVEVIGVVREEDLDQYHVTYEVTVDMEYADNTWKMELTDEFYNILLGGHAE